MKILKMTLLSFWVLCFFTVLTGCENKISDQNGGSNYEWELVIKWIGPEIAMEPTVDEWTLVLRWNFEDHTDHVFLRAWKWEDRFSNESEYLPWNTVKFKWYVNPLDWAAGNHYYDVINIEKIKVTSFLNSAWVKEILDSYNYCESDNDCAYIIWECPFGCFIPLNKAFVWVAWDILNRYFEINGKNCVYDCVYMDTVACENYKCVMQNTENEQID